MSVQPQSKQASEIRKRGALGVDLRGLPRYLSDRLVGSDVIKVLCAPHNKSLDASGGSVFRNWLGAAQGASIRAAASTQTLGCRWKIPCKPTLSIQEDKPMKKFTRYLFGTAGFVVLVTCLVVGSSLRSKGETSNQTPPARPMDVNVVNEPTVKLAQGATVQIGNLASTPLSIRNTILPINRGVTFQQGEQPILAVPAGKRFIIEYASGTAQRDTPSISIKATAGGQTVSFPILPLPGSQLVRIYADPNTSIVISAPCVNPCVMRGATVSISGHLEDAQ